MIYSLINDYKTQYIRHFTQNRKYNTKPSALLKMNISLLFSLCQPNPLLYFTMENVINIIYRLHDQRLVSIFKNAPHSYCYSRRPIDQHGGGTNKENLGFSVHGSYYQIVEHISNCHKTIETYNTLIYLKTSIPIKNFL